MQVTHIACFGPETMGFPTIAHSPDLPCSPILVYVVVIFRGQSSVRTRASFSAWRACSSATSALLLAISFRSPLAIDFPSLVTFSSSLQRPLPSLLPQTQTSRALFVLRSRFLMRASTTARPSTSLTFLNSQASTLRGVPLPSHRVTPAYHNAFVIGEWIGAPYLCRKL